MEQVMLKRLPVFNNLSVICCDVQCAESTYPEPKKKMHPSRVMNNCRLGEAALPCGLICSRLKDATSFMIAVLEA
eukprot:1143908-Pelagomonas_calceolata.AAC.4